MICDLVGGRGLRANTSGRLSSAVEAFPAECGLMLRYGRCDLWAEPSVMMCLRQLWPPGQLKLPLRRSSSSSSRRQQLEHQSFGLTAIASHGDACSHKVLVQSTAEPCGETRNPVTERDAPGFALCCSQLSLGIPDVGRSEEVV